MKHVIKLLTIQKFPVKQTWTTKNILHDDGAIF